MGITRDLADKVATGEFGGTSIGGGGSAFSDIKFNLPSDYENIDNINIVDGKISIAAATLSPTKVPPLTSNTSSTEGTASASSFLVTSTSYYAWRAFNGTNVDIYDTWISEGIPTDVSPEWLQFQFNSAQIIRAYEFETRFTGTVVSPNTWKLLGSNDGTNWDELHSVINDTVDTEFTVKGPYTIENPLSYTHYRLHITARNGESGFCCVGEFRLFGSDGGTGLLKTTNESSLNLTYVSRINDITINNNQPSDTTIKGLVSFDGRQTWEKYSGGSWSTSLEENISTEGMTISEIQNALAGYQITSEISLDFLFYLNMGTSAEISPSIDSILIQYGEPSSSLPSGALESIKFDNADKFDLLYNTRIDSGSAKLTMDTAITDQTYGYLATDALYYNEASPPSQAIDGNANAWASSFTTMGEANALTVPAWWSISYGASFILKEVDLRGSIWFANLTFSIQGSNNGVSWVNIQTGLDLPYDSNIYTYDLSSNTIAYSHYRIYVTAIGENNNYWGLSYVRLRGLGFKDEGYFTTNKESNLDLHFIDYINDLRFVYSEEGTSTITAAVSFDGRQTWKAWDSNTQDWISVNLANIMTEGNTLPQLEAALKAYTVSSTDTYLDFSFGFTFDGVNSPLIDSMVIKYTTSGVSRFETVDLLPIFTEKDEGRILYQRDSKKINFGTEDGWQELVTIPSQNYPTKGLIAEWKGNLDGSTLIDTAGNYSAKITGTAINTPGKIDNAISFDGATVGDMGGDRPELELIRYSLSVWFKPSSLAATQMLFANYCTGNGILLGVLSDGRPYLQHWDTSASSLFAINSITLNEWNHIVYNFHSDTLAEIYINSSLNNSGAVSYPVFTAGQINYPRIGGLYSGTGSSAYANGEMNLLRLYNQPLTSTEISLLYNNGLGV